MRLSSACAALLLALPALSGACTLFAAGSVTPCDDDDGCPSGDTCVSGFCNAGGGKGEGEGEGDGVEGEGDGVEGEGDIVVVGEGEGDGTEGEGDIVIIGGEGEGDVVVGEGEGEPPPVFFEFCGDVPPPPWADPAFAHRLPISFCDTGAPATAVVDLPVLIKITNAAVLSQFQANGLDVRFIDQRDGTTGTVLSHERVLFSASSATFFVKMPSFEPRTQRDHIWMYFGGASADTSVGAATYSSYQAVFHMEDNTGFESKARRAADVVGTAFFNGSGGFKVSSGVGFVDNGVDIANETCDINSGAGCHFMILDDDNVLSGNNSFGLSTTAGTMSVVVGKRPGGAGGMSDGQVVFYADGQAPLSFGLDQRSLHFTVGPTIGNANGAVGVSMPSNPANLNAFDVAAGGTLDRAALNHVVITWAANKMQIFVNGNFISENAAVAAQALNTRFVDIGTSQALGNTWSGTIDELRLSNLTRDAAFIRADFKSTSNTLATFGAVENR